MPWYMLQYILLSSVEISLKVATWHQTDSNSAQRDELSDGTIVSGGQGGAENLLLGLGVRTVTPPKKLLSSQRLGSSHKAAT